MAFLKSMRLALHPTVRRLLTPLILVSPLITLFLAPAITYGLSSGRAVDGADQAILAALTTDGDRVTINQEFRCAMSDVDGAALEFASVEAQHPRYEGTLSSVGFDRATIAVTGLSRPPTDGSIPTTADDVTAYLHRHNGAWCLQDLKVAPAKAG